LALEENRLSIWELEAWPFIDAVKLALDENAHIRVIRDCQNCEKVWLIFLNNYDGIESTEFCL
jgi:hypothetical protein